jgi:hypothetical protein
MNTGHDYSPVGPLRTNNTLGKSLAYSGAAVLWAPEKHLITASIQDAQGVRLLRHVQRLKKGLGSHLRVLQVVRIMFNPVQSGMNFVCISDPEKIDKEHSKSSVLLKEPVCLQGSLLFARILLFTWADPLVK